jgi:hypothetical protein
MNTDLMKTFRKLEQEKRQKTLYDSEEERA